MYVKPLAIDSIRHEFSLQLHVKLSLGDTNRNHMLFYYVMTFNRGW